VVRPVQQNNSNHTQPSMQQLQEMQNSMNNQLQNIQNNVKEEKEQFPPLQQPPQLDNKQEMALPPSSSFVGITNIEKPVEKI